MLSGFVQRSIWRVWSRWPTPSSVLLFCLLKRAVYLLPVNQHLPNPTAFSPHCYSPPSLCCQFASLLPFLVGVKRPYPLWYYHHHHHHHNNHNHLFFFFFSMGQSRCMASKLNSLCLNMCITPPRLSCCSHTLFLLSFFTRLCFLTWNCISFSFCFLSRACKKQSDRCLPRHALLRKCVPVGGCMVACMKRRR